MILLNSTKPAPQNQDLQEFEDGMLNLLKSIKFNNKSNHFQQKLKNDKNTIKNEKKVFVPADKTTNFYKIETEEYQKLLDKNVTKEYKKSTEAKTNSIFKKDQKIAKNLGLDDRIYKTSKRQAFITIKDHKPNYRNNTTCRLLNPTKSEIGKISKQILEKINQTIKSKTSLNQWKNTSSVINWYKNIPNKKTCKFIQFDVCNFYPSISEKQLLDALDFASNYINITEEASKQKSRC